MYLISFVKCIPNYCYFLWCYCQWNFFLHFIFELFIAVYRIQVGILLIVYSVTSLNLFISCIFLVDFYDFLYIRLHDLQIELALLLPFKSGSPPPFFSFLFFLDKTSSTMLNRSGDILVLFLVFRGKANSLLLLSMSAMGFL